ncbi:MAG: hypothetical protein ABWY25_12125 [Paenisporosarcina sp.]
MIISEEYYLKHAGTKGMRWGVRKQAQAVDVPTKEPKLSRKEKKAKETAALLQEKSAKLNDAISIAKRNPDTSLIRVDDIYGNRVMTGREFGDYLMKTGGQVPFNEISVLAEQNPGLQFTLRG